MLVWNGDECDVSDVLAVYEACLRDKIMIRGEALEWTPPNRAEIISKPEQYQCTKQRHLERTRRTQLRVLQSTCRAHLSGFFQAGKNSLRNAP